MYDATGSDFDPDNEEFPMDEAIVYVNGAFVPESAAHVSVLDRGFTSGEGVYEVTRTFGHRPFKLEQHIARLYRSLKYARIDCGIAPDEMVKLSLELLERNRPLIAPGNDVAIWQVISRGVQQRSLSRKASAKATVVINAIPVGFEGFARSYIDGTPLVTPATRRIPSWALDAKAKITNKMNHTVAMHEARLTDPRAEPLMLDGEGNITETHNANFFFVVDGVLHTPRAKNVLGGITRVTLFELAAKLGIPVQEGNYTPYDVYNADEAFAASTSPTIAPVRSLDGIALGHGVPGPVTLKLITAWSEMVGIDIVDQALSHLPDRDKQTALARWQRLRADA
jgi:branched-chain amino acid aminotransferase